VTLTSLEAGRTYYAMAVSTDASGNVATTDEVAFTTAAADCVDIDGDGVCGSADLCPTEAEDIDGIEDADGCVDPDAPACADVTGDGQVTIGDALQVVFRIGARLGSARYSVLYDLNRDGVINFTDVVTVAAQIGQGC
jgi:hypothetical protein